MLPRPPTPALTDTLFPYPTLFRSLGSEPLEPETTRSYTIGAVWNPTPSFTTTVDLYQIDLDDRIGMSSSMSLVADAVLDYRSEEHTSELQSLMRISYTVYCLKQKKKQNIKKGDNTRKQQQ